MGRKTEDKPHTLPMPALGPLDVLYNEEEKATINGMQSPIVSQESELRARLRSANLGSFCEQHRKLLSSTDGVQHLRKQAVQSLAFLSDFAAVCTETGVEVDPALQQFGHELGYDIYFFHDMQHGPSLVVSYSAQESQLYRPTVHGVVLKMSREEYHSAYENAQELRDFMPVGFNTIWGKNLVHLASGLTSVLIL
jgi:hypothetical protein